LDLCHYGIVPALLAMDETLVSQRDAIYEMLTQKDSTSILALGNSIAVKALAGISQCYGEASITLEKARKVLPGNAAIDLALNALERLVNSPLWSRYPQVHLSLDLADLRGYGYHNGVGFAAYVGDFPTALARGGRYDNVGKAFGRARPATGFSLELRDLNQLRSSVDEVFGRAIRAPWSDDAQLLKEIARLRTAGEIVVQVLPGHEHDPQEFLCDRELKLGLSGANGAQVWQVAALASKQ
jgi:ATP phosphoribosyltransferase regulatory subunit